MSQQKECKRCGICCENGGPALHGKDLSLIEQGHLTFDHLITIRKGELAHDPVTNIIEPVKTEFIKISGSKGSWACTFYNVKQNGCTIYAHRPIACGILKCWDSKEILALAGTDLLSRHDIVKESSPLKKRLIEHEALFPLDNLMSISQTISRSSKNIIKKLERVCNKDIAHRIQSIDVFNLSVAQELFYFGRPVFELLRPLGFTITETASGIKLRFK